MKPHKHAELIKAWADGAEIQRRIIRNGENIDEPIISYSWLTENMPMWSIHEEYRIKPEPKPDVVVYVTFAQGELEKMVKESEKYAQISEVYFSTNLDDTDKLKLTFDGETGELKSAEVLKG